MKISKLTLLIIATSILLGTVNVFAGNTNDLINRARLHRDKIIKEIAKKHNNFSSFKEISIKNTKKMQKMNKYQQTIEVIKNKHLNRVKSKLKTDKKADNLEQAIVFVSFSMPDLSLKQIIHDAAKYQVPVVIRGLYKNSFRKTIEKIFEFVKENNKGGIAISPRWFREYGIKAVPAVVVSQKHKIGETKSDVVYGNIPIKRALSIIAERGEKSNAFIARNIISRGNK